MQLNHTPKFIRVFWQYHKSKFAENPVNESTTKKNTTEYNKHLRMFQMSVFIVKKLL